MRRRVLRRHSKTKAAVIGWVAQQDAACGPIAAQPIQPGADQARADFQFQLLHSAGEGGLGDAQAAQTQPLSPQQRQSIIASAAAEVRAATVFGEAIIAVVYVPILSLSGIEGKLFAPMATTVLCALLGAMICSLTVVPALCSLLLRPRAQHGHLGQGRGLKAHDARRHRGRERRRAGGRPPSARPSGRRG